MIRLVTSENDLDFLSNPNSGVSSILYELGFDLSTEFVEYLSKFVDTNSVFDLLRLYIIICNNNASIICAGLLVYYDNSALDNCVSLLSKKVRRYTSGFNSINMKLTSIVEGDNSLFSWLGYDITYNDYLYSPIDLINLVSSIDSDFIQANNYLQQGHLLLFVIEAVRVITGVDVSLRGGVYSQWFNLVINKYPLGSNFSQSIPPNTYV